MVETGELLTDSDPGNWESQAGQKQVSLKRDSLDLMDLGEISSTLVHVKTKSMGQQHRDN